MKIFSSKYFWGVLLLFVILAMLILFISPRNTGSGQPPSSLPPTPFILFFNPTPTLEPLSIVQRQPNDGDTDVDPTAPITVTFSRAITGYEKLHIRLGIIPTATSDTTWSNGDTQLSLVPQNALNPLSSYSASLIFQDKTETWSFTTGLIQPTPAPEIQQGRDQQAMLDDQWSKIQQNIYANYPWYDSLPISSPDYFVSFDIAQNAILATLFPKDPTDPLQIEAIKKEVIDALTSIKVDPSRVKIIYQINGIATPTPAQ